MYKHLIGLLIGSLTAVPSFAQDAQSKCLSTHFYNYYGPIDTVKIVTIERMEQWSNWCKQGYQAKDIEIAIRPCYQQSIEQIHNQNNGYSSISYQQSRQIKAQCTQQLWQQVVSSQKNPQL